MSLLLSAMHPSSEWALMFEVAPRTGGGTRYADALAVNLWKSRGYAVHGFEIKVSRGDWQRELKSPQKSEEVLSYCDFWWVVAPEGVVKPEELPMGWGLLQVAPMRGAAAKIKDLPEGTEIPVTTSHKLAVAVKAAKLKPQPVSREFFASLMRRANEVIGATAERHFAEERNRMWQDNEKRIASQIQMRSRDLEQLEKVVADFKAETGLELSPWSGPPRELIALAQKFQEMSGHGKFKGFLGKLTQLSEEMNASAERVRNALALAQGEVLAETSPPMKTLQDLDLQ